MRRGGIQNVCTLCEIAKQCTASYSIYPALRDKTRKTQSVNGDEAGMIAQSRNRREVAASRKMLHAQ